MNITAMPLQLEPGRLLATPAVLKAVSRNEIQHALQCHLSGDWGDVSAADWRANMQALKTGARLFSVYHTSDNQKFWIITEADRSATTVLLPEDY